MGNCAGMKSSKGGKKKDFVMSQADVKDLRAVYDIDQANILGSGSFGKVFKAVNKSDKSIKVAIKVINKRGMTDEDMEMLKSEVQLMQQVDHSNIVKYYETFNDKKYIYLVMELCTGGDLFKCIDEGRAMTEAEAALQMDKCLRALQHCHAQKIIHRDIKPENIMYDNEGEIKLIDFGFALVQKKQKAEMDIAGTPYYIAPEVLSGNYGKECDVWSMGVCLFQLLTGELPFQGTTQREVFGKIQKGEFEVPQKITSSCKDLLEKMISVDVRDRYTVLQCLDHPWIKAGEKQRLEMQGELSPQQAQALNAEVIANLKKYRGKSLLKKAAMNVLVKHLQPKTIQDLKREFEKLDKDNSGFLEITELKQAIENADGQISIEEIDSIIRNLDYADNQQINYSEFIAATIDVSQFLTDDKIEALFKTFDVDNSGKITADNIKMAFTKFGKSVTDEDVAQIMKEHDLDGEGTVDLEEFKTMITGQL